MKRSELLKIRAMIEKAAVSLADEDALEAVELFPAWTVGVEYHIESETQPADRVQYDGLLYKCVQSHTSQADWTPSATPALWVQVFVEEWPEWVQPTGAHDAYEVGAKVSHNGSHWINTKPANVYEPGVWGWDIVE